MDDLLCRRIVPHPAPLGRGLGGRRVVEVERRGRDEVVVVAVVDRPPEVWTALDRPEIGLGKMSADVLDVVREVVAVEAVLVVGAAGAGDGDAEVRSRLCPSNGVIE